MLPTENKYEVFDKKLKIFHLKNKGLLDPKLSIFSWVEIFVPIAETPYKKLPDYYETIITINTCVFTVFCNFWNWNDESLLQTIMAISEYIYSSLLKP